MNSRLPIRLLSLVLIAVGATATLRAAQVALIADASVNSARSSTNFGGLSNLYTGNGSTTLLRFDLGTLPAGTSASQISRATLTIFVNRVNATGSVTLSPITSAWTESAVTDDTIPTIGAPAGSFTASTAGQFITID
ncbi:MAG: DNRLRE domain-containing protein, partial [Acidobacteriaceae bacterium]